MTRLEKSTLTAEVVHQLTKILRIQQHLLAAVDLAVELVKEQIETQNIS